VSSIKRKFGNNAPPTTILLLDDNEVSFDLLSFINVDFFSDFTFYLKYFKEK
jgi:hypothetical protein